MKTKPWKAKRRFCAHRFFAPHNYLIPIEESNKGYIAYITSNKFSAADDAMRARLIAAAPDMLEALKKLFEQCAMVHKHWGEGSNQKEADDAIEAGKAAIAKAEGKE